MFDYIPSGACCIVLTSAQEEDARQTTDFSVYIRPEDTSHGYLGDMDPIESRDYMESGISLDVIIAKLIHNDLGQDHEFQTILDAVGRTEAWKAFIDLDNAWHKSLKWEIDVDGDTYTLVRDDSRRREGEAPYIVIGYDDLRDIDSNVVITDIKFMKPHELDIFKRRMSAFINSV